MSRRIKVLPKSQKEFDAVVKHGFSIGIGTKAGKLTYDAVKSAIVIELEGQSPRMMRSNPSFVPKDRPYKAVLQGDEFLRIFHIDQLNAAKITVPAVSAIAIAKIATESYGEGYDDGFVDGVDTAAPQTTLKCSSVEILTQNPIVWASKGAQYFKDNGIELVEADGKLHIIDEVANTATEFTPKLVADKAKEDLLKGDKSVYTDFVKNFELINTITYEKVLTTTEA